MTGRSRLGGGTDGVRKLTVALSAVIVVGLALAVASPWSALASPAPQSPSGFTIERQAAYTRTARVVVGDGGWTPFFSPAVLVWDGGSIIGGSGASPGLDYASQTIRLLPHPCLSYMSRTNSAKIADMIAEAPLEVDARYHSTADADICLVMAGGGDIVAGNDVNVIFADLQRYCLERRAAGFRIVVLTLLPRSKPAHFEDDRLALNALLRDDWPSFVDGLADIAADHRIGDPMDNLNRKYYHLDGTHPTDAGYAVMAAVTAPVLNALEWRSDECEMRLSNDGVAWTDWHPYVPASIWELSSGDGTKTVYAEYRDGSGEPVPLWDTIQLDTVRPVTFALRSVSVLRGRTAALPYLVADAEPCGPTAKVTIYIKDLSGRAKAKLAYNRRSVNTPLRATFVCRLAKGVYRYFVYATDTAGNRQSRVGVARLTVK